jgi:hypothetical protein
MLLRCSAVSVLAVLILGACGRSEPQIPGFDAGVWRRDSYACQNLRGAQAKALLQAKEQLYGTTTADIEVLLGRPDEEELGEQTEKTYFYYIESGPQCEPRHPRSAVNKLSIRFGAIGTATEILTERPVSSK